MSDAVGERSWGWAEVDAEGPSAAGRRAAQTALAAFGVGLVLAYDGARPIVSGGSATISISHTRRIAVAVVGRAPLGVDLCELERGPQLRTLLPRFATAAEQALVTSDHDAAVLWAAKEAGLKALGLGLLDGGVFDDPAHSPVQLASLVAYARRDLSLLIEDRGDAILALAYTAPSTTTVAPFM